VLNPIAAVDALAHMSPLAGVFSSSDHLQTVTALAAAYSACQEKTGEFVIRSRIKRLRVRDCKPRSRVVVGLPRFRIRQARISIFHSKEHDYGCCCNNFFCIEFYFPNYRN
jgi:hypothetical protein